MDLICSEMIPQVAKQGIAKFNDVFCEKGYFNIDQSRHILLTGKKHGLIPRIHSDEFSCFGASKLAADLKVMSADHLMEIDKSGIEIENRQSRIRKSFSMNDMKSFLIHEAKIERNLERTTVLDSRSPVPVIVSNQDSSLLKPMRSQQLLK